MNQDGTRVNRWTAGPTYGPVLGQTDLYLLKPALQIHPILARHESAPGGFSLQFDLSTGQVGGYNTESADRLLDFIHANEPATLPRVEKLYIITDQSPWCTTVQNPAGVTLSDVTTALTRDYLDNAIADHEIQACPPRVQETIKRFATTQNSYNMIYSPHPAALKRVHWLRDRHMFDNMQTNPAYAEQRLGFSAPNVFIMRLASY
ncbi:hypothetical protein PENSPDRAFT_653548 [Peniophora sp. CONT]|nr:hypothetical protein PENSPDRAFT_653548 [Peniophora sp. CONT]